MKDSHWSSARRWHAEERGGRSGSIISLYPKSLPRGWEAVLSCSMSACCWFTQSTASRVWEECNNCAKLMTTPAEKKCLGTKKQHICNHKPIKHISECLATKLSYQPLIASRHRIQSIKKSVIKDVSFFIVIENRQQFVTLWLTQHKKEDWWN